MVVDDDQDIRETMLDVLEATGRRVFVARDGSDALRMLEGEEVPRPCVILLDWLMPPMDGAEFLTHLQSRPDANRLPVIVTTASDRGIAGDLGPTIVGVLRKPFDVEELVTMLEEAERSADDQS
jgi:CheY-like chemotaxis protein